jgi:hypothetical protein
MRVKIPVWLITAAVVIWLAVKQLNELASVIRGIADVLAAVASWLGQLASSV